VAQAGDRERACLGRDGTFADARDAIQGLQGALDLRLIEPGFELGDREFVQVEQVEDVGVREQIAQQGAAVDLGLCVGV